jgi:ribosomal protein S18 acetylase RimI-like enzyme
MVAGLGNASALPTDPHVRQIDPWRDGRAVANLLESAFRDEIIDDTGQRLINALRNHGMFDALAFGFGTGFVWVEEGHVVGNASVQRNFMRRDTWIIGNVATLPSHRNRGIGRAVVDACVGHAMNKGARFVALQADAANAPALHLYEKVGFERLGEVSHYLRPSLHALPMPPPDRAGMLHRARWSDRHAVWALAMRNVPDVLTFAEPYDSSMHRLGLRWSVMNALNGNPEQWWMMEGPSTRAPAGAARTRANIEGSNHAVELLLGDEAGADEGRSLLRAALERLRDYAAKPIYSAQSQPHVAAHAALSAEHFQLTRTLVHMRLAL